MNAFRSCAMSLALFGLICSFTGYSSAQSYPAKVVRYLVPYGAGGGADIMARIIALGLAPAFGQQVIVENRPGAGGNIGMEIAARAPADGHTLVQITVTNAVNVSLYPKLPFDLMRDFSPVTQLASLPAALVVHPSLPVRSVGDLVKLAKAKPGAINYSSGGVGTTTFFAAELLKAQAAINMLHVPYRSAGDATTAVIGGETSVYFPPLALALPHVQHGKLRALAVTSARRAPVLPELPTVAETGYPGYESVIWYGLLVPVKTPKETIATIRSATVLVLKSPDVTKRLIEMGYVIVGGEPEEFAAYIKSEVATLAKIIRQTGIVAE